MSFLEQALMYWDMGWCVYPAHSVEISNGSCSCGNLVCPCPGKHPVGRWMEYQRRRPTRPEVRQWFSTLDCNVGTVTGMISKIAVVDVDGEKGLESLDGLDLDPTLSARTGGGGLHLFYSLREPARSKVGAFAGIDIRANGGYVVLPPSLHSSGRTYTWKDVEVLAPFEASKFEGVSGKSAPNWSGEVLQGVHQGNRSVTATRLAGKYFNLGLSLDEVWLLMTGWNSRNIPPLETSDLDRTVIWVHRKNEAAKADPVRIETLGQIRDILGYGKE